MSRIEHGKELCHDSITLDEEKLQQAIQRGLSKAITDRREVYELILSNVSYAVTGSDDTLEIYAIEKQIQTLKEEIDEVIQLATKSTGDMERFQREIKFMSEQIVALREHLELKRSQVMSNEQMNLEIEKIKEMLSEDSLEFSIYRDENVRLLVECIRVMKDGKLIITLKGGLQIEEMI